MSVIIDVYDVVRKQWRDFAVVPFDAHYLVRCRNGLHQFAPSSLACACGAYQREKNG